MIYQLRSGGPGLVLPATAPRPLQVRPRLGGGQSALYQSLVAYWALDEASGSRADSIGGNTLTDNNTVGATTGIKGNAASHVRASSEYLSSASNATLQAGNIDFAWFGWVKFTTRPGTMFIVSKDQTGSGNRDYIIAYETSSQRILASVFRATDTEVSVSWNANAANDVWYFFMMRHDATADTVTININNGTPISQATGGSLQAASSSEFRLGSNPRGSFNLDGLLDEIGYCKGYIPDADDESFLYNSGAGRTLDDIFAYAG